MTGERYTVQAGDSLWKIAQAKMGDGHQWTRVWRYNNRADVVKVTGRGIPDADLIYPGQTLRLPVLPAAAAAKPSPPAAAAAAASPSRPSAQPLRAPDARSPVRTAPLPHIIDIESPISIKYRLDDLKFPPFVQPGGIMEMKMTADVILTSRKTYPAASVTQRRELRARCPRRSACRWSRTVRSRSSGSNSGSRAWRARSRSSGSSRLA